MTKQEQMIEYMVQDLIEMICESQNIEYDLAMNKLYNSELFEKIQDTLTGLYKESPAYVYCLLEDEFKFGRIVQLEI